MIQGFENIRKENKELGAIPPEQFESVIRAIRKCGYSWDANEANFVHWRTKTKIPVSELCDYLKKTTDRITTTQGAFTDRRFPLSQDERVKRLYRLVAADFPKYHLLLEDKTLLKIDKQLYWLHWLFWFTNFFLPILMLVDIFFLKFLRWYFYLIAILVLDLINFLTNNKLTEKYKKIYSSILKLKDDVVNKQLEVENIDKYQTNVNELDEFLDEVSDPMLFGMAKKPLKELYLKTKKEMCESSFQVTNEKIHPFAASILDINVEQKEQLSAILIKHITASKGFKQKHEGLTRDYPKMIVDRLIYEDDDFWGKGDLVEEIERYSYDYFLDNFGAIKGWKTIDYKVSDQAEWHLVEVIFKKTVIDGPSQEKHLFFGADKTISIADIERLKR